MPALNKVFLIGNLAQHPRLRYTPSGTAVADLRLAVNRRYVNGGGKVKEDTLFISAVVWSKPGEVAAQYLAKGSPVHVEGWLQSRTWETKDGERRTSIEVVAERLQFLSRRGDSGALSATEPESSIEDEVPF